MSIWIDTQLALLLFWLLPAALWLYYGSAYACGRLAANFRVVKPVGRLILWLFHLLDWPRFAVLKSWLIYRRHTEAQSLPSPLSVTRHASFTQSPRRPQ
jgi:hypothetical protein